MLDQSLIYSSISSSISNPVKDSSFVSGNFFLIAWHAHAGSGILVFPITPYTILVNFRYATLRKNLEEINNFIISNGM